MRTPSARSGELAQARTQRARGGVGVARQQHERVPVGGVGGVHPGVGADEAVTGAADQHAALGAQQLGGLVEDHLHHARVLVRCSAASSTRASARAHARERHQRALGLGDDLVGDRHDRPVAQRPRAPADVERSGPRGHRRGGSPAGPSAAGREGSTPAASASGAHRGKAGAAAGRPGRRRAAHACAGPRRSSRRGAGAAPARSTSVSMSSSSEGGRCTRSAAPPASTSARWRSKLPGPKLGAIASGGASSRPLVPLPWRSGTITTSAASADAPAEQLLQLRGRQRGAVAGHAQHPLEALLEGALDAQRGGRRLALVETVLDHHHDRARAGRGSSRLAGDDDRQLDRGRVPRAPRARRRPSCARARPAAASCTPAPSRRLAAEKRLTGRIAAVRIARPAAREAKRERPLRPGARGRPRRPCGCRCEGVGRPGTSSSATIPSSSSP